MNIYHAVILAILCMLAAQPRADIPVTWERYALVHSNEHYCYYKGLQSDNLFYTINPGTCRALVYMPAL